MCSVYLSLLTKGKRIKYAIWDKRVLCAKRKTASKHVFVFMLVIICIVWNVFSRYTTSISSEQIMLAANNYLLGKLSSLHYRIAGCSVPAYVLTESDKNRNRLKYEIVSQFQLQLQKYFWPIVFWLMLMLMFMNFYSSYQTEKE